LRLVLLQKNPILFSDCVINWNEPISREQFSDFLALSSAQTRLGQESFLVQEE